MKPVLKLSKERHFRGQTVQGGLDRIKLEMGSLNAKVIFDNNLLGNALGKHGLGDRNVGKFANFCNFHRLALHDQQYIYELDPRSA